MSVLSRILAKIIIKWILDALDTGLRKKQVGFRREWRCTDQIFTLHNITEQCTKWQRQLYINFVDFEKAFSSIHRDSLWRILRVCGIPLRIVQITESFYHNCTGIEGSSSLKSKSRQTFVRDVSCVQSYLTRL